MKYEVKKIEYVNKPQIVDATTLKQFVNCTMGIVGNEYPQFTAIDTYIIEFPNTGLDAIQIEQFVDAEVTKQAHEKYPNT